MKMLMVGRSRVSKKFAAAWLAETKTVATDCSARDWKPGKEDAVYISTPHTTHAQFVERALLAGKHVMVEKPMCFSSADYLRLMALACDRGLALVENVPFLEHTQIMLAAGAFVRRDGCRLTFHVPMTPEGWRSEPSMRALHGDLLFYAAALWGRFHPHEPNVQVTYDMIEKNEAGVLTRVVGDIGLVGNRGYRFDFGYGLPFVSEVQAGSTRLAKAFNAMDDETVPYESGGDRRLMKDVPWRRMVARFMACAESDYSRRMSLAIGLQVTRVFEMMCKEVWTR